MVLSKLSISSKILIATSILLMIGIPFANRFIPYTDTFGRFTDVWDVNPASDPHFKYRFTIIKMGLGISSFAFLTLICSFFIKSYSLSSKLLDIVLFLFIFSLGVKNYPYWANGLFYAFRNGSLSSAYDPKAILPMIEFGEVWRDIIFYFYLTCIITIPFLAVRQIIAIKAKKELPINLLIAGVSFLLLLSFFFTPNYFGWLVD